MNAIANPASTGLQISDGPSVLGERQIRIPVGGKIRSGIKVLIKKYQNDQAQELYERGVAAGAGFMQIDRKLVQLIDPEGNQGVRTALTPRNVPYFTVRRADFAMPEVADKIMDMYAEDRDEGHHLYRLPIILATDSWLANMPHGMKCFTRSEMVYWSEYGPDGNRYCKTRGEVEVDEQNKRARRSFGGRPIVMRGQCEPNKCPEYQNRQCKLSGQLLFYVPGIPGSSAIELATTSFYSLQQMRQQMEMVAFIRGGKISGTLDGKPIFYLAKKHEEVSMLDENGKPRKVKQWLIRLEADIDMTRLFQESEPQLALESGAQAAAVLTHQPAPAVKPLPEPEETVVDNEPEPSLLAQVADAVVDLGIDKGAFTIYAADKCGDGWKTDDDALRVLLVEIAEAKDDPQAYAEKVAAADEVPF